MPMITFIKYRLIGNVQYTGHQNKIHSFQKILTVIGQESYKNNL